MKRKIIAFYLPQFHIIPENDRWWGNGFTEWVNVKKAKPLFNGHQQPREPLNNNYYNLLDIDTMKWQIDLANKYGVYGFCFYHYWFKGGKKLLEKPVEMFLQHKELNIHFCLSWANEAWSRTWDGGDFGTKQEILQQQEYGNEEEWEKHIDYILNFCSDDRYIKIDNKPLIVIYKPNLIHNICKMMDVWEMRSRERGFDGICLAYQSPECYFNGFKGEDRFNYIIRFEPLFSGYIGNPQKCFKDAKEKRDIQNGHTHKIYKYKLMLEKMIRKWLNLIKSSLSNTVYKIYKFKRKYNTLTVLDYDDRWKTILDSQKSINDSRVIPGAFVSWDNTPRKKTGVVYVESTPDKFEKYLSELINVSNFDSTNLLFVNAWNEWAEGAYLEPDTLNEYKYLEAIKKANL